MLPFSFLHVFFAILGLGFLIFIHEFGHFWVARRKGMKVEAFSIGFGKPIRSWERKGVKWQIGWLPFGGYVKIAGMQKEGSREPYEIPDGFYGKTPWQRIQVAFAGPLVNILFALLIFSVLWISGGREKRFYEFTHRIGWVDPGSLLYQEGVRPGDLIEEYASQPFRGFKDLVLTSAMEDKELSIQGTKIDYLAGTKTPFNYTLPTYETSGGPKDRMQTIGVMTPAKYMIFKGGLPPGSPMENSGIQVGDRIVWIDGEPLFSLAQLGSLINESTVFLTVEREGQIFQTKVPRVHIDDLKMSAWEKGEVDDWQHEAGIKTKLQDLNFIPYSLSPDCVVEARLAFIDEADQVRSFQRCQRCSYFNPLQEGDRILAIDGQTVSSSFDLLQKLQERHVLIIVERDPARVTTVPFSQAEREFEQIEPESLKAIVSSLGTGAPIVSSGHLVLLQPVIPKRSIELMASEFAAEKKKIETIKDPRKRDASLKALEQTEKLSKIGIPLEDRDVIYNPNPFQQFSDAMRDTWRTMKGLFSGILSPKYLSGPIGIVTVIQYSWLHGVKEALFWIAVISLNLGIMNLLPIPVLDGGHILFSLWEIIFRRKIKAKTMERLIIPFVGLLIVFFIFVTYHDIARLFGKFL
jgi:regulator of sigma E protease